MAREADTARIEPHAAGELQPQHSQRDRYAATGFEDRVQVAVVRVVVVIDVSAKVQIAEEKLVEHPQALQRWGIGWQATFDAGQQLINIAEHLLHIQIRVLILGHADGGFQQRKMLVTLYQAGKVLKG